MKTGQIIAALLIAMMINFFFSHTIQAQTPANRVPLNVIATHSILGDLVARVGGDAITLHVIVGPDGDSHTYEPIPADNVTLNEANIIFETGLHFEGWLDALFEASESKGTRIVVTQGIIPLGFGGEGVAADERPLSTPVSDDAEVDPHFWQDVANAINAVNIIRDTLVAADPANEPIYRANATAYLAELHALDDYIVAQTELLPIERRILVTNHDAFGYFAYRYGYTITGSAFPSFTTEAEDPSAQDIAQLVDVIKASGAPAIFPENIENAKLIERIAGEAGVAMAPPLFSDALGQPGTDGDTYIRMMRFNIDTIVAALSA